MARRGEAERGWARHGRPGTAWHSRRCMARQGKAGRGGAYQGMAGIIPPGGNAARTGHRNPNARLTPEAVRWVRESHQQGRSIAEMARELGVHHSTVSDVVRGVSWRGSGTS